ncbi:MAG: LuxR C-terminal-related transcriptional regulator [Actinomycetota bacterium]
MLLFLDCCEQLAALGEDAAASGEARELEGRFYEALGAARRVGAGYLEIRCLQGLAAVHGLQKDWETERRLLNEALELARVHSDDRAAAVSLARLADLAAAEGDSRSAYSLISEAIELQAGVEDRAGLAASLSTLASLGILSRRFKFAAHLHGAAQALVDQAGVNLPVLQSEDAEQNLSVLKKHLGVADFQASWEAGTTMNARDVAAYASRGRGTRERALEGWESLTEPERSVMELAIEGLTSNQIGERIFISPRTVDGHASNALRKLGIPNRRELIRQTRNRSQGPGGPHKNA